MKALKLMLIFFFSLRGVGNGGIELYMADPEVRIAQKIYCQITGVSSEDKLHVALDNKIIFQKDGDLQPEEIFIVDYRNQTAGQHNLVASILTENDQVKESITKTWTTLHDGIPIVGIDENNAIRLNGELFFPVYAEVGKGLIDYWVHNGYLNTHADMTYINGRVGYSTDYALEDFELFLDQLVNLGVRNIGPTYRWYGMGKTTGQGNDLNVMADYVNSLKDHSGVLMWQWADEPDRGGDPALGGDAAYPSEIRSWHEVVHQYDTNHPHAVNLTAYAWARDGAWYIDHCGDYSYLYGSDWHNGEKKLVGDIIGCDFYPIEFATKVPENFGDLEINFETMAKALDRITEWNYNLCPIFSWNEPCDLNPDSDGDGYADGHSYSPYKWTPPPTPEELWAEYWLKIIHGVKGIKLHPYFDPAGTAIPPYNHLTMAKFLKWIEALKHGILGPDYEGTVTDEELLDGRIDIMAKSCNDTIFIVAGNLRYQKEKAKFTIKSLPPNYEIEVYGEARSITAHDGYFEDDFDSLAIHIYKIFMEQPTPVELIRFEGHVIDEGILLNWKTTSEHNNSGFELQRSDFKSSQFKKIGFVSSNNASGGNGQYHFVDKAVSRGIYFYRLKKIDLDGSFHYLGSIEVNFELPERYHLAQNYPNPFNTSTTISYNLPIGTQVELSIYDITSKEVYKIINEFQEAGSYNILLDACNLTSGQYFYRLKVADFKETKRMLIIK